VKLGEGKAARVIRVSMARMGPSFTDDYYMCCFCGDAVATQTAECRNCGAALAFGAGPATEIERRDIQIHGLKCAAASSWDFTGFLLSYIVALEKGRPIPWPPEFGGTTLRTPDRTPAEAWLRNNWQRDSMAPMRRGETIAIVTQGWAEYGRPGDELSDDADESRPELEDLSIEIERPTISLQEDGSYRRRWMPLPMPRYRAHVELTWRGEGVPEEISALIQRFRATRERPRR
jgi:hypothetical protein